MSAAGSARPAAGYRIALLPGDGIGVDVAVQARRLLETVERLIGVPLHIDEVPCGAEHYLHHGTDWPEGSEAVCERADAILLGAVGLPRSDGRGTFLRADGRLAGWSAIVGNRQRLDLYANIRPVRLLPGIRQMVSGTHRQVWEPDQVDMVFVRENTEDLYAGAGGILAPGGTAQVATDSRIVTRAASERVVRLAFEMALRRAGAPEDGRRRVTCVGKDNVLHGCRLFQEVFEEVGADYPEVEREVVLVDAFAYRLMRRPEHCDVVVTTNMFGDILTELAAVLQGGLGMAVGCNIGDRHGMFEPIHGSAPAHAGRDRINPMAMLLAVAELLRWLATRHSDGLLTGAAYGIDHAVRDVLLKGESLTYDLVGHREAVGTAASASAVLAALETRLSGAAA
ncbi:isocitrate/isopropylmalate dehydrogenase family protein [Streptomyces sp. NPDC001165]|uniref:isocitrate/isopropylmalate dehydrogenase family protein n=1 Tax=Streptomyces sp. NPDC001165 TaxID=3364546 RepID=UPI0036A78159